MLVGRKGTMRTPRRLKLGLLLAFLGLLVLTQGTYRPSNVFAQDESADTAQASGEESGGEATNEEPPPPPPDTKKPDLQRPVEQPNRDNYFAAVDANGVVVNYWLPLAFDDRDGQVPVDCQPIPGTLFPLGKSVVTCRAWDAAGNMDEMIINIFVTDQTAPVIDGGTNVEVTAIDPSGANVEFGVPNAWDNVDGQIAISCDAASGAFFPVGTTIVTCWAQDGAGNAATPVSFSVTVYAPAPTEPPTEEPTQAATETPTPDPTETATEVPATGTPATESPETKTPTATKTPKPGTTPTEEPSKEPTQEPTKPSDPGTPTDNPTKTPTKTPSDPTDRPTTTPTEKPNQPTTPEPNPTVTTPEPTPTHTGPEQLELPWPPPEGFVIVVDGGPLDGLAPIWNNLDFPISQEYGHTEFSIANSSWYTYGLAYGMDGHEHPGLDIGMPRGTPLYSPVDGTVKIAGGTPYYTFYGNGEPGVGELLIETKEGHEVILGHMGRITVKEGDKVKVGQFVGLSGGDNGDHLHLETRELQPLGSLKMVDPRKSFLIDYLKEAAQKANDKKAAASKTENTATGEARFRPLDQSLELVGVVGEAPSNNDEKYAQITVRRVSCPVDQDGDIVAACGDAVKTGTAFTVYNPTNHGKTRSTNENGVATFGPRAGQNAITGDDGTGQFTGAYVSCQDDDTGRVLFDGIIETSSVSVETEPGEHITCSWYDLSWLPSGN